MTARTEHASRGPRIPEPGSTLVVGGNGRTGRHIVAELLAVGEGVRVLSRHARPEAPGVDAVHGDLAAFAPETLEGIGGVIVSVEPPADAAGADAVLNRGVAALADAAATRRTPVVLISQISITRPQRYPAMRGVIAARGRGEHALRSSGADYVIVRPGWLTDEAPSGARVEQGDTGDGKVSRATVGAACVAALRMPAVYGRTFELFDAGHTGDDPVPWSGLLSRLAADGRAGERRTDVR